MSRFVEFQVGAIPCWAVSDAGAPEPMHVDDWKLTAEPDELQSWFDARGEDLGAIPLEWICLLARLGDKYLLVEAGSGPKGNGNTGCLVAHLRELGITPDRIDTLVVTHTHYDHIGGTLDAEGQPVFPNARVVLYEGEREQLALTAPVSYVLYEAAQDYLPKLGDAVQYLPDGGEVLPGVRLMACPGHTIGHTGVLLRSQGQRLLFTGDLFYHALQVEHPGWNSQYDLCPDQTPHSRVKVYQWAAHEGVTVLPAHVPLPGLGRIVLRADGGYGWEPLT
ncbi:MAG: MBL fold metallo-hydrolase [Chloroflexi bacterium]|nr:MBL fold metallo-hydrolase [Chloroflexota bacterium]